MISCQCVAYRRSDSFGRGSKQQVDTVDCFQKHQKAMLKSMLFVVEVVAMKHRQPVSDLFSTFSEATREERHKTADQTRHLTASIVRVKEKLAS